MPCCSFEGVLRRTFGWAEHKWNDTGRRIEATGNSIRSGIKGAGQIAFQASGMEGALTASDQFRTGTAQVSEGIASLSEGITTAGADKVLAGIQMQMDGAAEVSGFVENTSGLTTLTPAVKLASPVFLISSLASNVADGSATAIEFVRIGTGGATIKTASSRAGWTLLNVSIPGRVSQRYQGREQASQTLTGKTIDELKKQTEVQ